MKTSGAAPDDYKMLSFLPQRGASPASLVFVLALAVLISLLPRDASAQSRRIELADYQKIVSVSDPQISPDNKSIVFIVSRVNMDQDRHDTEIVSVDIASGAQRILTFERKGVSSPRWSPAGDRIAFLAETMTGKAEKRQINILSMNGGDPRRITDAPNGIEQFAWRPGGADIAYVTSDEADNKKEIEKHNDAFEVGDDDFLATSAPTPSHIWLVSANGGQARRLTSGSWSLPKSNPPSSPNSPLSWSPDGKSLVFTKRENPHIGDSELSTLQILNVETGETRKLTSHDKYEGQAVYSPDGSQITFWYPGGNSTNNQNEIWVTSAAGGDGKSVTQAIDRNILRDIWMPDGKSLLVGGHDGSRVSLWLQLLNGTAKKLALGEINPSWSFWIDASVGSDGSIAFSGNTPNHPSEIYYMSSVDATPKRLTDFNHEIAALDLGKTEAFEWQGPDGFREDGIIHYPPGFSQGKKYPLVLVVHGGPRASSTTGFNLLGQLLAARDYVVFEPNYRGSDNLGNKYEHAIWNDAGDGPGRDVMAGVDALVKRGFIDESRIAVSGWSYGGYMTTWLIGHYHIWKVAVAGAAVTNMVDQYNLADFNVRERFIFQGSPWVGDNMKAYREQSPITYAAQMKTPTLILSDTGDFRVTVTQSYELYHALKDNGVTTHFFAYPVRGHFPDDPVRVMDVYRRWVGWIADYLK